MTPIRTGRMTTAERVQIAQLAAEGKTPMETAVALARSFGTINSYIHRLQIPAKTQTRYLRWTPDQDCQVLAAVREGQTDAAIGALVGRTGDAVHARIGYLGGRALILYPAGPSAPLPLPAVQAERPAVKADPYHLWSRANARLQARRT